MAAATPQRTQPQVSVSVEGKEELLSQSQRRTTPRLVVILLMSFVLLDELWRHVLRLVVILFPCPNTVASLHMINALVLRLLLLYITE